MNKTLPLSSVLKYVASYGTAHVQVCNRTCILARDSKHQENSRFFVEYTNYAREAKCTYYTPRVLEYRDTFYSSAVE